MNSRLLTAAGGALLATVLAGGAPAGADVIAVPGDVPTIQDAIDASSDGDTVIVAPGLYLGSYNHDLDFGGRAITVRSTDPQDPAVVAATVIDCQQSGRGFIFQSGETTASIVEGLTVINGFALDGAGVYLLDGSGATIRNCVFSGHTVPAQAAVLQADNFPTEPADLVIEGCAITGNTGGGVGMVSAASLVVTGTTIDSNTGPGLFMNPYGSLLTQISGCAVTANGGAGVDVAGDFVEVTGSTVSGNGATGLAVEGLFNGTGVEVDGCTIAGNTSDAGTGGFVCHSDVAAAIRNCMIVDNTGRTAGGLALSGFGSFEVRTSTIAGNTATEFGGGGVRAFGTEPTTIHDSILWGNTAADEGPQLLLASGFNNPAKVTLAYCDVEGGVAEIAVDRGCCSPSQLTVGPGNVDVDPQFADAGAGDYHLSAESAAIDAGDPAFVPLPFETDVDGDPRVVGPGVDLGADEFRRPADLNGDGLVGVDDFLALFAAWGPCPNPPTPPTCIADLNGDGAVGVDDMLALFADWG